MNRRGFTRLLGATVVGASLSGCVGSEVEAETPNTAARSGSEQDREIEDRVRFSDLSWGHHCVPSPCMWSLQATMENLSGETLVVGYVLSITTMDDSEEYTAAVRIGAWDTFEVVIRTEIPDTELQPTDFELIPIKLEQPVSPTPVPDPEAYAQIAEDQFIPDPVIPKITGVVENISDVPLSQVRVQGTFYVDGRAAEASNVVERDLQPGERRSFTIRYFRGNEASRVNGSEVEVIEVYR